MISPALLRTERDDPRKRSSDRVRLTIIYRININLCYIRDVPRILRVMVGFDGAGLDSFVAIIACARIYLLWRWDVDAGIEQVSSWVVLVDVDNVSAILKK